MAVKSNAFGGTTLTGADARKFKNQVTFGKPKDAAKESLRRGSDMMAAFKSGGQLTIKAKQ